MKADHVVMHTSTHKFECTHCGATYQPTLPMPIDRLVNLTEGFILMHKDCKPTEERK